jgi:hypothetical protein
MDLNPAFLAVIAARVFNRSRVDRARRSSLVTVSTSPASELVEQATKLCAVGLRPARHFAEHLFASRLGELAHLGVNALAVGGYPRVAVFHTRLMAVTYAIEKPFSDQSPNFLAYFLTKTRQVTAAKRALLAEILFE